MQQASSIIKFFLKYVMSMVDVHMEGRWETKSTYVFYLELVTDLLHLFVYCVFFLLVFTNYGLPLHLVRELYSTFRNFRNRIVDFLRFRQVRIVVRGAAGGRAGGGGDAGGMFGGVPGGV